MNVLKQFRFVLWLAVAATFLGLNACQRPVANPLVRFDVPDGGFAVTSDNVAGADSVRLEVFAANGNPLLTLTGAPGEEQVINIAPDANAPRPLQLCFTYRKSGGGIVTVDSLRIDDTQEQGIIPDMDVVMFSGSQTACPSTTSKQSTTNGGTTTFSWTLGESYEVTIVCSNVTEKIRLTPEDGTGDNPGTVKVFKQGSYSCLTNPNIDSSDPKVMALQSTSFNGPAFSVRATDDNDGMSPREVVITHATGCTVTVRKN